MITVLQRLSFANVRPRVSQEKRSVNFEKGEVVPQRKAAAERLLGKKGNLRQVLWPELGIRVLP
jgi:hypothetical protein